MIRRPVTGRPPRLGVFLVLALLLAASTAPRAASPDVVISQVYGAGGNSGAVLRNDFVELFNRGTAPVSLAGLSIQYASATGTGHFAANGITAVSGMLAPGQYYLVQLASGGANGSPLPVVADVSTTATNMAAGAGKVVLVRGTTGLACNGFSTPCSDEQLAAIVDLFGWGTANFFEGSVGPGTSTTTAAFRVQGGCTDLDNNGLDFVAAAPNPRNTATPTAPCLVDTPPSLSSTEPADGAAGVALAASLSATFSEPVSPGAAAFQLSCSTSGVHPLAVTGGPVTFTLDPASDFTSSETCTLTVAGAEVVDQDGVANAMAGNAVIIFSTVEVCGEPSTRIHTIQSNGLVSLLTGSSQVIEGVVTADLQGPGQFAGYFVQQEDALTDGDPATSEGLFVFNTSVPVAVGDKVRVRGTVVEFGNAGATLTELSSVTTALVCASAQPLPDASVLNLPVASFEDVERYEGMRVTLPQALTVSETFTLARFGELVLSSGGRLPQPTNVAAPGAAALAQQAENDRNRIVLDDTNNQQNIDPTRYPAGGLSASNTVRVGDRVTGVAGILEQRFGAYRIQPDGVVSIDAVNLRPTPPAFAGGTLRVASFNVLNYFNGDGRGGGFPTARGATTPVEFERQRAKTIAALAALDADVVGLMELENDAPGSSAIEDLVAGLNAATAPGTYAFIATGIVGTDEIRVALIYKPAVVTPFNQFAILDSSVDPEFLDTKNRPALAQTFTQNSNGKKLTVVVNHLKSKGSDCNDVSDPDTGDGQGHCNLTRTRAAAALVRWLAGDPTGAGDPDVLLIGDMNSYAKEDPIAEILGGGYDDLIARRIGSGAYSYVFAGQSGYLDHALASTVLTPRVTGVGEWHINADEPVALDYNVEFKTTNQVTTFYAPDAYRSSDHDPVVVDLNLIEPFDWSGFFSPVGELNLVHAGGAIPIKFSLGGNRGLDIFAAGSPSSSVVPCEPVASGTYEPTVSAGASALSYDPVSDRYTYVWKTQKQWAGTCRELRLMLVDGTSHSVTLSFTK